MVETTELYGGSIQLEFDSGRHTYRVINNGRRYKVPSVTSICGIISKPALIPWAVNATIDVVRAAIGPGAEYSETYLEEVFRAAKQASGGIKKDAASRGTDVHRAIEAGLVGGTREGEICPQADAVIEWLRCTGSTVVETERRIYSRRYRYSGTLDAIVEIDGRLVLLDWKTGGRYADHLMQTAAYQYAFEEETGQLIDRRILVSLKDGLKPHPFPRSTYRRHLAGFLGALRLFTNLKKAEKDLKDAARLLQ